MGWHFTWRCCALWFNQSTGSVCVWHHHSLTAFVLAVKQRGDAVCKSREEVLKSSAHAPAEHFLSCDRHGSTSCVQV